MMFSDHPLQLSRRAWLSTGGLALAAGAGGARVLHGAAPHPVRLSLNENSYGPSPSVGPAIARALPGLERYVTDAEVSALAGRIAAIEDVAPDQIVIGEVLGALGVHLARERHGGTILYSSPGYTELVDAAAPLGGVALPVPLNDRLENDLPALARAVDARTLAVSLVNPHNPSGTMNDGGAFDAFVRETARRAVVVVDEAYLEYDDLPGRSAIRLVREGANVVVFRTLAKIYGLAGLAIGYAIAPRAIAARLKDAGVGAPHSQSRLALAAASAALVDQRHVTDVRTRIAAERVRMTRELDRLGLTHSASRASFVFWRSPRPQEEVRAVFRDRGIEIARPFPPLDDWIRVTIGLPSENDAVIAALRSAYAAGQSAR